MKTFDITTDIAHDYGISTVSTFVDGTAIEENFRQDEAAWARELFGSWFADRELAYGRDYHLERCPGGSVRLCFSSAGEALWFEAKHIARRAD